MKDCAQSDRKVTPKENPKGAPMEPQRRQMEPNDAQEAPQWTPKVTNGAPMVTWGGVAEPTNEISFEYLNEWDLHMRAGIMT